MTTVSARLVHDAVWDLLDSLTGVDAYDGEVPNGPALDQDGRVHAYAVLYAKGGLPLSLTLDATQDSMLSGFQVTCVGGDPRRALWCLDRVRSALVGADITLAGRTHTIAASDTDPGPTRRDDDVTPARHYVVALFDVFIP